MIRAIFRRGPPGPAGNRRTNHGENRQSDGTSPFLTIGALTPGTDSTCSAARKANTEEHGLARPRVVPHNGIRLAATKLNSRPVSQPSSGPVGRRPPIAAGSRASRPGRETRFQSKQQRKSEPHPVSFRMLESFLHYRFSSAYSKPRQAARNRARLWGMAHWRGRMRKWMST